MCECVCVCVQGLIIFMEFVRVPWFYSCCCSGSHAHWLTELGRQKLQCRPHWGGGGVCKVLVAHIVNWICLHLQLAARVFATWVHCFLQPINNKRVAASAWLRSRQNCGGRSCCCCCCCQSKANLLPRGKARWGEGQVLGMPVLPVCHFNAAPQHYLLE